MDRFVSEKIINQFMYTLICINHQLKIKNRLKILDLKIKLYNTESDLNEIKKSLEELNRDVGRIDE